MKRKILITMTIALALVLGGGFYLSKKNDYTSKSDKRNI